MEPVLFNTIGALLILAAGTGLGFWIGNRRRSGDSAKASEVQEAFDDYRRNVTEHFGQTADHFQAIGKQYRELYEHMASGAEALCDIEDRSGTLSFPKAVAPALTDADAAAASPTPEPGAASDQPDAASGTAEGADTPVAAAEKPESAAEASPKSPAEPAQAGENGKPESADPGTAASADGEKAAAAPKPGKTVASDAEPTYH